MEINIKKKGGKIINIYLGNKGVPRKLKNLKSKMEEKEMKKKTRKKEEERL